MDVENRIFAKHNTVFTQLISRVIIYERHSRKTKIITTARVRQDTLAWLANVETIQRDVRKNRLYARPTVLDVYHTRFFIPHNYTVEVLSEQFHAYDNGEPDGIYLFSRDENFHFISN